MLVLVRDAFLREHGRGDQRDSDGERSQPSSQWVAHYAASRPRIFFTICLASAGRLDGELLARLARVGGDLAARGVERLLRLVARRAQHLALVDGAFAAQAGALLGAAQARLGELGVVVGVGLPRALLHRRRFFARAFDALVRGRRAS